MVCTVKDGVGGICVELFSKYLNESHFLIGNGLWGLIPQDEASEMLETPHRYLITDECSYQGRKEDYVW